MAKPIGDHSDQELRNIIGNHRNSGKLNEAYYLAALEELARRKGHGLDFQMSLHLIRKAAAEGRFLSYKELVDESGSDWLKMRYAVNAHLGDLINYSHGKGWPLLSAIVVNQQNVATGDMELTTLNGFVEATRALGYAVATRGCSSENSKTGCLHGRRSIVPRLCRKDGGEVDAGNAGRGRFLHVNSGSHSG